MGKSNDILKGQPLPLQPADYNPYTTICSGCYTLMRRVSDRDNEDSAIKISNIQVSSENGQNILSADCDAFKLYYKFPDFIKLEVRADPFVAACLVPSMAMNSNIEIPADVPVSPALLRNIDYLQDIFSKWSGHFKRDFHKIGIEGGTESPAQNSLSSTMSFFSGGIDGAYTFLKNADEIDFLLFAKGIDMQLSSDDLFNQALEKNTGYLEKRGKQIFPIETNVRFLGHEYGLSWPLCFGGGLASIALASGVQKCFIASGFTYASKDYEGSNFITDSLWRNEATEIVHDGAEADRNDKLNFIASDPDLMNILRVCWQDKSYNCGECEKCLRTMTNLRALGLSTPTFPELTDELVRNKLSKLKLYKERDLEFIQGSLRQARQRDDKVLIKALSKIQRNYDLRFVLRTIRQFLRSL